MVSSFFYRLNDWCKCLWKIQDGQDEEIDVQNNGLTHITQFHTIELNKLHAWTRSVEQSIDNCFTLLGKLILFFHCSLAKCIVEGFEIFLK